MTDSNSEHALVEQLGYVLNEPKQLMSSGSHDWPKAEAMVAIFKAALQDSNRGRKIRH